MKAPDKIYLIERDPEDISIAWYDDSEINRELTTNDRKLAYIRKDALLEWAKEKLKTIKWYTKTMSPVTRGGCAENYGKADAFQELIDKINSL